MLSKQFARVFFKQKDFKCVCAPYTFGKKYSNQVNIVKSKIPSVNIPNILINEYAWLNVEKWYDKTAVVSTFIYNLRIYILNNCRVYFLRYVLKLEGIIHITKPTKKAKPLQDF